MSEPPFKQFMLLISGSRAASPAMLDYAVSVVKRAQFRGWAVIVGDAAGIDCQVITACKELGIPFHVFGITPQPRNGGTLEPGQYTQVHGSYPDRDRAMVNIPVDRMIGIWNGHSRGTLLTYNEAKKQHIPATLHDFSKRRA